MLDRYEALVRDLGEARVRGMMDAEELGILDEFREHGRAVKAERARAKAAGEAPNFIDMIRGWGGVTLAYRKRLQDAPAYRLNHEEVALALQEGISVTENMNPVEAVPDEFGHVKAMVFTRADGSRIELPAQDRAGRRRHGAERHLRERTSGIVLARQQAEVLPGIHARCREALRATGRSFTLEPDRGRLLHVARHRRQVRHLLRRQPSALQRQRRQGDGVGQARLSARRGAVRRRDRGARSCSSSRSAKTRGDRWSRRSTISCWRGSSGWSA